MRFFYILFSLVCSQAFSSAENFIDPAPDKISSVEIPVPGLPEKAARAEWTVMYFINGKNNLESSAMMDMNQLELAGSNEKVRIVVQMGRMNFQEGDDLSDGDWTGVRRYLVAKDGDTNSIKSPVLEDLGSSDMGSWKELVRFINWTKARYPARRYALVMWDHGSGWKPLTWENAAHFSDNKGFSFDDETGNEISTLQMAWALRDAGKVDFLMLDGCNMAMASVFYELKDYAEVVTASEETEPGVVVRYAQFLEMLNAKPHMGAEEFAVNTVTTYRDYFMNMAGDPEEAPVTQSAVRLSKISSFRGKLDAWALAAMKAEPEVLLEAKRKAKIFGEDPEYKDLYHFVELVTASTSDAALKKLGSEVMSFLKSELVIENWAQDEVSHGLSVYVPDAYDPLYDRLAWSGDGKWDEFAKFLAEKFGRPAVIKK